MEIQEIRESLNLSQSAFAKRFSIPVGTIQNWEQGKRKPPEYVISLIQRVLELEQNQIPNTEKGYTL